MGKRRRSKAERGGSRRKHEPEAGSPLASEMPVWRRALPLIVVAAAVLVYANSLDGAFILDDDQNIEDNRRIRSLDNLNEILAVGRPLVELSLALNYAYGELDPAGYHVFNILIHILVGLTLYGVVRRTLLLPRLRERFGTSSHWLALAIGLLWTVHPLTTQAVTYVIQRGESMGSLLYLLTLYCVIRGSQAKRPRRGYWYATAVISAGGAWPVKPSSSPHRRCCCYTTEYS